VSRSSPLRNIRKYGYLTLGEALASVRGFNQNYNRTYTTIGARGFNVPSDYGSRILVLVNGHNMADNIFDSMLWFGEDFPVDLKLMQRIEVIRGLPPLCMEAADYSPPSTSLPSHPILPVRPV
jgi:hypothetical protein